MNSFLKNMKSVGLILVLLALLLSVAYAFFAFYPYIFARRVVGVVEKVERVWDPSIAVMSGNPGQAPNKEVFSFAVGIREASGETVTASTEDRQWAAVTPGKCAEAKYYPYPPWALDKSGTYYGARLLKLHDCAP